MKKLLSKKVVLGSVLAIATLAGATIAGPSHETETTYYDASGQPIGGRLHACSLLPTAGTGACHDDYDRLGWRCDGLFCGDVGTGTD